MSCHAPVPVGVRRASMCTRMRVLICCTQHTRMSCTGTCICNIVSIIYVYLRLGAEHSPLSVGPHFLPSSSALRQRALGLMK